MVNLENVLGKQSRSFWMGCAIIWVFLYHLTIFAPGADGGGKFVLSICKKLFGTGFIGVDIFFFFSAFGLCFSYTKNNILNYYKRRFYKIYPLYIVFIALFIVLMKILNNHNYDGWKDVFIQGVGLSVFKDFDIDLEWFTPSLIFLYALFPLLYKVVTFMYKNVWTQLSIFILSIGLSVGMENIFVYNLSVRLPIIVLGIITYYNIANNRNTELMTIFSVSLLLSFIIGSGMIKYSLCIPAFIILISFVPLKNDRVVYKGISKLGQYTFEIYLAQILTTKYILQSSIISNSIILYLVVLCLTVVFAYFLYWTTKIISRLFIYKSETH